MADLISKVAQTSRELSSDFSQRRSAVVRVCGEEHSASGTGSAAVFLTLDNDMAYVSEMKFKLVFGSGVDSQQQFSPISVDIKRGTNSWPTLASFKAYYPLGSAIDVDGIYGCQCYDYANAFWVGQVGRTLVSGDNARGTFNILSSRTKNAGTEFDIITNWNDLLPGDWVVWGNGSFGHIAMAVDKPDGGKIRCWNQNVSGYNWPSGGKILSEDGNTSAGFLGAFRYKAWHN